MTKKGKEFIKLWNKADRSGIQKKLADHFGISVALVYRIRKKLDLPHLHDVKNHPGKQKLYKRIRRLYIVRGRSTLQIARIVRMNDETVRGILKKQNVTLRPPYVTDPRYQPTSSHLTPAQLLKEMKRLYEDEKLSAIKIAKRLGVDQATICKRLKALDIELRQGHGKVMLGGYKCQWCAQVMVTVYHNAGPRKQLYCSSPCSNKAKDYRRMQRGVKVSATRIEAMEQFLRDVWGHDYKAAVKIILSAKPLLKKKNSPSGGEVSSLEKEKGDSERRQSVHTSPA